LARRDQLHDRDLVGSLRGQVVLLDTPVLLRLLAPRRFAKAIETAIVRAIDEGAEPVVLDHTTDELRELINGVSQDAIPIEEDLQRGIDPAQLASLMGGAVLDFWLDGEKSGLYHGWGSFKAAAEDLPSALMKLGVRRRAAQGDNPETKVNDFLKAL
jgi:hypothetical protein